MRITHVSLFRIETGSLRKGLLLCLQIIRKSPCSLVVCWSAPARGIRAHRELLEGLAQQPTSLVGTSLRLESIRRNRASPNQRQRRSLYINSWIAPKNPKPKWNVKALLPLLSAILCLRVQETTKLLTGGNKTEFLIKIQSYYFPACGTETEQHLSVCHLALTFEQKFSDSPCLCFHRRWAVSQIAGCALQTWWSICEPTEVSGFAVIWILK